MQRSSADGRGDLCRLVNPTRTPALWAPPQSGQLKPAKRVAAEYVGNRPMKMQKAPTVKQRASTEGVHFTHDRLDDPAVDHPSSSAVRYAYTPRLRPPGVGPGRAAPVVGASSDPLSGITRAIPLLRKKKANSTIARAVCLRKQLQPRPVRMPRPGKQSGRATGGASRAVRASAELCHREANSMRLRLEKGMNFLRSRISRLAE